MDAWLQLLTVLLGGVALVMARFVSEMQRDRREIMGAFTQLFKARTA